MKGTRQSEVLSDEMEEGYSVRKQAHPGNLMRHLRDFSRGIQAHGQMVLWTNGQSDRPSYGDAMMHLKTRLDTWQDSCRGNKWRP